MRKFDHERAWERAHILHDLAPPRVVEVERPWGGQLGIDTSTIPRCGQSLGSEHRGTCRQLAGVRTAHPGTGYCAQHLGNTRYGETEGFMIMAIAYARAFNISPAQALLNEVYRSAGAVEFVQEILSKVETKEDLLEAFAPWVEMYERERAFGLKVNVAAINAGVMQILAEQIAMHGEQIARLMSQTLDELALSPEQEIRARTILAERMRALALTAAQNAHDAANEQDSTGGVDNTTGLD